MPDFPTTSPTLIELAAAGNLSDMRERIEGAAEATLDRNILTAAAQNGHLDLVQYLTVLQGANGQPIFDEEIVTDAFAAASDAGHLDVTRYLVTEVGIMVDDRNQYDPYTFQRVCINECVYSDNYVCEECDYSDNNRHLDNFSGSDFGDELTAIVDTIEELREQDVDIDALLEDAPPIIAQVDGGDYTFWADKGVSYSIQGPSYSSGGTLLFCADPATGEKIYDEAVAAIEWLKNYQASLDGDDADDEDTDDDDDNEEDTAVASPDLAGYEPHPNAPQVLMRPLSPKELAEHIARSHQDANPEKE